MNSKELQEHITHLTKILNDLGNLDTNLLIESEGMMSLGSLFSVALYTLSEAQIAMINTRDAMLRKEDDKDDESTTQQMLGKVGRMTEEEWNATHRRSKHRG